MKELATVSRRTFLKRSGTVGLVALGSGLAPLASPARAQAPTVTLWHISGLTGNSARYSNAVKEGVEVWQDLVNEKGGIKVGGQGYRVQVSFLDDKGDATTSGRLIEKVITVDKAKFLIGPDASLKIKSVAPINERYSVPMIASYAYVDFAYSNGMKFLFSALYPASRQMVDVFKLAASLKNPELKTVAYIGPKDEFGVNVEKDVSRDATSVGMRMIASEFFPPGTRDFAAVLQNLARAKPDVIVVNALGEDLVSLAKQQVQLKVYAPLVAYENHTGVPEALGPAASGIITPVPWHPTLTRTRDDVIGTSPDFVAAYQKKHGKPLIDFVPALGAHNCMVMKLAIEKAGTLEDSVKIRDAMRSLDAQTFFGPVKFDDRGMNIASAFPVVQSQNQRLRLVFPEPAEAKPVHPFPAWGK